MLDWANMPDPFRSYAGAPRIDLPADPPSPEVAALEVLLGKMGTTRAGNGVDFFSQLFFHAAAISAWKKAGGYEYALRVNPSSGNLHPTEFHFITRGVRDWPDGIYHYLPASHMVEQRALGQFQVGSAVPSSAVTFVLTSIAWREAWKYQSRAYRYCLHDIGHAWQSLTLGARAMGCESSATGQFADEEVARLLRFGEDEWPMLIVTLRGDSIPLGGADLSEAIWFSGSANQLSQETIRYPLIENIHAATKVMVARDAKTEPATESLAALPSTLSFGEVSRRRRSALDFIGGEPALSLAQLTTLLQCATQPPVEHVQLYVYVHRVDGLQAGVYRYNAADGGLELLKSGDQRVAAAGLSLGQDLAGNSCVTFSMIADLARATAEYGDRGYRYVHFEAGAIGQRLYLAAEALGLRATGIGAFFDNQVHGYLGLTGDERQVVYHFAIGYPVADHRLAG